MQSPPTERWPQPLVIDTSDMSEHPFPELAPAWTLEDLRREQETKVHRQEVDAEKWRIRIREEARLELRKERDAYLTSDEGLADAAQAFEAQIVDLDDIPDPEPLIDGYLHRDTLVRTFGPPKSLKSFVTLDMAACISLGIEWQGFRTVQTKVLYIVAEGARGVKKRRAAWNETHETEMKVIFYPKPVQINDPDEMHRLIAYCRVKQVGYVIFDTQARCTVGVEENDNTEMGEIVSALDILKQQTGACVHLVHHSGGSTPTKARGATAFDGAVDAEFYTERSKETVKVVTKFQKDIGEADDLLLETREVAGSLVLERADNRSTDIAPDTDTPQSPVDLPECTEKQMIYLRALNFYEKEYVAPAGLAAKLKEDGHKTSGQLARNKLIELKRKGLADNDPREPARWGITPKGVMVLAREIADRAGVESAWVDRARRRRVSQGVSDGQAKLTGETSETSAKPPAKPSLTSDETYPPESETYTETS